MTNSPEPFGFPARDDWTPDQLAQLLTEFADRSGLEPASAEEMLARLGDDPDAQDARSFLEWFIEALDQSRKRIQDELEANAW